jgi:hypothetical protein
MNAVTALLEEVRGETAPAPEDRYADS